MKFSPKESILILSAALLITLGLFTGNSVIALLACALIGAIAFYDQKAGLYILLISIPLRSFFIALNPGFKLIGDLIILGLLLKTIYINRKNLQSLIRFQLFEYALFAFCAVGVISALATGVSLSAIIFQIRAYILFYLIYYVVKRMDFTEVFLRKSAFITFITALVISLHGFVEKISDKTVLMPEAWTHWTLSATNHVRVYGLLKGPNELALYLLISYLVSLYLLRNATKKGSYFIYGGLSIIGATFLLTYSRGAILALGVFVLAFLLVYRSLKGILPIMLASAVSLALFFGVNYAADMYENYVTHIQSENSGSLKQTRPNKGTNVGADRFKEAFSEDTIGLSAADGRIYYVTKAIEVFKDHPFIGTGFATFGGAGTLAFSSPIYEKYEIGFNFYSDNQYILTLAETGVMGVLILCVFVFGVLAMTLTLRKKKEYAISLMLFFFFITMMVGGLVYNILENDTFMLYYFLVLGYAYQKFYPRIS